jgi:hypothetical protein
MLIWSFATFVRCVKSGCKADLPRIVVIRTGDASERRLKILEDIRDKLLKGTGICIPISGQFKFIRTKKGDEVHRRMMGVRSQFVKAGLLVKRNSCRLYLAADG